MTDRKIGDRLPKQTAKTVTQPAAPSQSPGCCQAVGRRKKGHGSARIHTDLGSFCAHGMGRRCALRRPCAGSGGKRAGGLTRLGCGIRGELSHGSWARTPAAGRPCRGGNGADVPKAVSDPCVSVFIRVSKNLARKTKIHRFESQRIQTDFFEVFVVCILSPPSTYNVRSAMPRQLYLRSSAIFSSCRPAWQSSVISSAQIQLPRRPI
jgi:hypothetical protein